ncbi:MAG: hypothetical protein ACKV0T_22435 [Planctomycetales bacterium]
MPAEQADSTPEPQEGNKEENVFNRDVAATPAQILELFRSEEYSFSDIIKNANAPFLFEWSQSWQRDPTRRTQAAGGMLLFTEKFGPLGSAAPVYWTVEAEVPKAVRADGGFQMIVKFSPLEGGPHLEAVGMLTWDFNPQGKGTRWTETIPKGFDADVGISLGHDKLMDGASMNMGDLVRSGVPGN